MKDPVTHNDTPASDPTASKPSATDTIQFSSFNLAAPLMRALTDEGYTTPTPIQAQAIPILQAGHDLLGIAQTGTGKTAAFALPTLDYLAREDVAPPKRGTRVLVVAPTRELAQQISQSFKTYGKHFKYLSIATVFGGASVRGQIKAVVGGNDIVVATPGRLLDLIQQKALRLSDVEVLILDEADQMMDMGFINPLRQIAEMCPSSRQTLFFSATMPKAIEKLAKQFLTDPQRVTVAPAATTADRVSQQVTFVNAKEKQALLVHTLQGIDYDNVLVFSRTKHGADRIVKKLAAAGLDAAALHGNKSQGQRQRILGEFRTGKTSILVATDIAARGIDIDGITHVINFDLPNVADQYVHRIGRTARAGRSGLAISFCAPDERPYLKDIQKLIKQTLPVKALPDNFNAVVSEVSKLKPVVIKRDNDEHSRANDPRAKQNEGRGPAKGTPDIDPRRDKKRRANKRKKHDAARADLDLTTADGESPAREKSRGPQRSNNPDGSRADRKQRRDDDRPKADRPKSNDSKFGKLRGGKPRSDAPRSDKPRSDKPRSDKARSDKPRPDKAKSGNASGGSAKSPDFKRKTRKAPEGGGNRGGTAPPKRRGSR